MVDQCRVLMEVMEALAMRAAQVDQAALVRMARALSEEDMPIHFFSNH